MTTRMKYRLLALLISLMMWAGIFFGAYWLKEFARSALAGAF
jgi:hypothetical protein